MSQLPSEVRINLPESPLYGSEKQIEVIERPGENVSMSVANKMYTPWELVAFLRKLADKIANNIVAEKRPPALEERY